MPGFMVAYFAFIGCVALFALASWVGSLVAIYDCARRDFDDPGARALWCLLLALVQGLGALLYYFMVYRPDEPPVEQLRLQPPGSVMGHGS